VKLQFLFSKVQKSFIKHENKLTQQKMKTNLTFSYKGIIFSDGVKGFFARFHPQIEITIFFFESVKILLRCLRK
jgi:hypothetical protein